MAIPQFLILCIFIFPAIFGCLAEAESHCLRDLNLKISQLDNPESKLAEVSRSVDEKGIRIEHQDKLILRLSQKIHFLQSTLKTDSSSANEKLSALEKEVQSLWSSLRKSNFDIHVLKEKALESEERLEAVSAQAEKMNDVVNEQWIQLQRLEQALYMTEMRTLSAQRKVDYSRCSFLRFINKVFGDYLLRARDFLNPCVNQIKKLFTQTKYSHHQLQRFIKREMDKSEFTAAYANGELVFFLASALITFPILGAWMLLSSQLR